VEGVAASTQQHQQRVTTTSLKHLFIIIIIHLSESLETEARTFRFNLCVWTGLAASCAVHLSSMLCRCLWLCAARELSTVQREITAKIAFRKAQLKFEIRLVTSAAPLNG
jgi:hypothetical protein